MNKHEREGERRNSKFGGQGGWHDFFFHFRPRHIVDPGIEEIFLVKKKIREK
jgi:hypothetical protein